MAQLAPRGPLQPLDLRAAAGETLAVLQGAFGLLIETALLPCLFSFFVTIGVTLVGWLSPLGFLLQVTAMVAQVAFAVAWHRVVLLGPSEGGAFNLRLGPRELRYLAYCVAISLAAALLATPVSLILWAALGLGEISRGFFFVLFAIVTAILSVLSLVLPAVALELPGFGLREAWAAARGILLPLVGLCLLVLAPAWVALQLLLLLVVWVQSWFALTVPGLLLLVVGNYLLLALGVTVISVAFRQRTGWTA
ncbi:MAG: hypothetical protein ACREDZ_10145 [Kiloniellales bacterium]